LPVKQIPPYSYTPFKIKTTCSFVELAQFVKSVESSRYIINIESVKLDSKESVSEPSKKDAEKKNLANVEIVIGTIY
jgi:Tfp pilus assembly protein PilO